MGFRLIYIFSFRKKDILLLMIVYIYLFFIIIIFFIYGLVLSETVDHIFPNHDDNKDDYKLGLEIAAEMAIAYAIYYLFKHYINNLIVILLKRISKNPIPNYLNHILLFAFSFGVFRHLQKSTEKTLYFRKKFVNPLLKKIPYCQSLIVYFIV